MKTNGQSHEKFPPVISVIVPVYNCEAYIEQCIRSIFAQTQTNIEILILDDASTDNTILRIEELIQERPPEMAVRIIHHETNCGIAVGRNEGVEAAQGKYLFFMDGDDWISPDCLEKLLKLAEQHEADVSCGTHVLFAETDAAELEQPGPLEPKAYTTNEEILEAYCGHSFPVFTWNKLVRRDLFTGENLHFEESITNDEDQLWSFRLVMRAKRWVSTDAVTYFYRQDNEQSITSLSVTERRLNNYYKVLACMWQDVENADSFSTSKKKLLAQALHNFTKSILWHVEQEPGMDFLELYREFGQHNIFKHKNWISCQLGLKNRVIAIGWNMPYPVNRCFSPRFVKKQQNRFTGSG